MWSLTSFSEVPQTLQHLHSMHCQRYVFTAAIITGVNCRHVGCPAAKKNPIKILLSEACHPILTPEPFIPTGRDLTGPYLSVHSLSRTPAPPTGPSFGSRWSLPGRSHSNRWAVPTHWAPSWQLNGRVSEEAGQHVLKSQRGGGCF